MKSYFQKLYQFNSWANDRVLATLRKQHVRDEKILSLLGHYLAAQFLWLFRIKGLPAPDYKLWGDYSFEQLEKMSEESGKLWLEFVGENENFNRELTYKNYVGDSYTNNVESIMIHLVNHSTYHRAQIALLLRERGFEAINTDFITFDRVIRGEWKE
ncbi:MAG TPA: DinB family protein [Cyclobacteriaceae bacterium]|nr:DinB family protein [Cyclobacteriaceae bacterium]